MSKLAVRSPGSRWLSRSRRACGSAELCQSIAHRLLADALFHLVKQCCPASARTARCDCWVGCLSQEYSTRVSRKSSSPGPTRTVSASGMARFAHRHGYQTDRAQACGRSGSSDGGIGLEERALQLLASTQGDNVLHTSFIERINGTFRERLASLTRRCRHASHSVEMLEARDVACWLYLQLLLAPSRARADNGNRT